MESALRTDIVSLRRGYFADVAKRDWDGCRSTLERVVERLRLERVPASSPLRVRTPSVKSITVKTYTFGFFTRVVERTVVWGMDEHVLLGEQLSFLEKLIDRFSGRFVAVTFNTGAKTSLDYTAGPFNVAFWECVDGLLDGLEAGT